MQFKGLIQRATDWYHAALAALQTLDPNSTWSEHTRPLLDEDLRGLNGLSADGDFTVWTMHM